MNTRHSMHGLSGQLNGKRICVLCTGHLSTCPRMLKAADSFAGAGAFVHVVSTSWLPWAKAGDADVLARRRGRWSFSTVHWDRETAPARWGWSALRHRWARRKVQRRGAQGASLSLLGNAHVRINSELAASAKRVDCDLFYGGGSSLAATAMAADSRRVPFALDLEDFHSGEHEDTLEGRLSKTTIEEIEARLLMRAAFLTAGSAGISAAYTEKYGCRPIVVNNTFPLPLHPPNFNVCTNRALRLYWFSQTIGLGRGLEEVIRALGIARIPAELHLRGRPANGYLSSLMALGAQVAPKTRIVVHEPAPPDDMVSLARDFDIGLAVEETKCHNRRICLTNKALTYILAGLAVVFTDTPGQRPLAVDLGPGALLYPPGDSTALALGLHAWSADKSLLNRARQSAWERAVARWHWHHPSECGALLSATTRLFNSTKEKPG